MSSKRATKVQDVTSKNYVKSLRVCRLACWNPKCAASSALSAVALAVDALRASPEADDENLRAGVKTHRSCWNIGVLALPARGVCIHAGYMQRPAITQGIDS